MTLVSQQPVAASPPALSMSDLLDRWEAGARLIDPYDLTTETVNQSYTVVMGGVTRLPRADESFPPSVYRSHLMRRGESRFGEFGGDGQGRFRMSILYDGARGISETIGQNEFSISPYVQIFGASEYEDYESYYRIVTGTTNWFALAKARKSRVLPREGNLHVVDVPSVKDGIYSILSWRVWLDPAKNFMPTRWTQSFTLKGKTVLGRSCSLELKEVNPGVWAPVVATAQIYDPDEKSPIFGKVGGKVVLTVDLSKSRFNVGLPEDRFVAKIPSGATVVDRARNVVYKEGSSDPDGYLAKLAADAKQAVDDIDPEDRIPPPLVFVPEEKRGPSLALILAVVGVVLVLALIGYRSLRRRSS